MNDGFRNDPAVNEPVVFGAPAAILPIDAVSELCVLSKHEPEYWHSTGCSYRYCDAERTTKFHGSGIEYFRDNASDARNYFNAAGQTQAPFPIPDIVAI